MRFIVLANSYVAYGMIEIPFATEEVVSGARLAIAMWGRDEIDEVTRREIWEQLRDGRIVRIGIGAAVGHLAGLARAEFS